MDGRPSTAPQLAAEAEALLSQLARSGLPVRPAGALQPARAGAVSGSAAIATKAAPCLSWLVIPRSPAIPRSAHQSVHADAAGGSPPRQRILGLPPVCP
eukprot:1044283-Alexandrium_andersonii.AAC.1